MCDGHTSGVQTYSSVHMLIQYVQYCTLSTIATALLSDRPAFANAKEYFHSVTCGMPARWHLHSIILEDHSILACAPLKDRREQSFIRRNERYCDMNFNETDDLMHQVLFHITCYERRKVGVQWLKPRMKAQLWFHVCA